MGFDIITMGPLIVEIIRIERNRTFCEAGTFAGPFPSGDTPIFIHAAAKMGMNCGFLGSVGADGFGKCVFDRMKHSGVDMTHTLVVPNTYTGSTFVYYNEDDSRDFMYHLKGSGSEVIYEGEVDREYFKDCKWVHYTGFTMESSPRAKELVYKTMEVLDKNTKVSFDPNLRPGHTQEEIMEMVGPVIERADLILPSKGEASKFFGGDDYDGCMKWMKQGKMVVQKRGAKGSRIFYQGEVTDVPSFEATEIDPTGAGDTFCAAFLTGLVDGKTPQEAARFANVAGGFAISAMGPMEGAVDKNTIEEFLNSNKTRIELTR